MVLNSSTVGCGNKPIVRIFGVVCTALLIFSTFQLSSYGDETSRRLRSSFSEGSSTGFVNDYDHPKDLILPQRQGSRIAAESLIGKVTILFHGRDPTLVRAIQTHEEHNRRYGYPLLLLRHTILDGIWSKPAYLLAVLLEELRKPEEHRLRWLFWVDADTIIMNPNIPLEIFLPPDEYPHVHLLITADPHSINNGVFFLKVHPWSLELLSAVIAYRTFRPDTELQYRDQSALADVLKEKQFKRNFILLPQRWFNAYWAELADDSTRSFHIRRGDLLVHFPGHPQRDEAMQPFLDRAEQHMPEWELDLVSTTYGGEIKEFWAQHHQILEKERAESQKVAQESEEFLSKIEDQLAHHRAEFTTEDLEKMFNKMRALKTTLTERRDDKEALQHASDELHEATETLRSLAEQAKEVLLKQVHAVIVAGERELFRIDDADHLDVERELEIKVESLQELLVREADNTRAITDAMEEVKKVTMEVEVDADKVDHEAEGESVSS